jgi:hypothetical protein
MNGMQEMLMLFATTARINKKATNSVCGFLFIAVKINLV